MSETLVYNTNSNILNYRSNAKNSTKNLHQNLIHFQETVDSSVVGWFYFYDNIIIHELLKTVQQDIVGDVCEIGVAYGKSALALSNYKKDTDKLYLYEIFSEDARIFAEDNIKKYGTFENIEWRIQDTTKLKFEDVEFDSPLRLLHIDGCHEHVAVCKDMRLFSKKMAHDGVIVLDDFNDSEYPGVNSGCMEFLSTDAEWRIFAIGQNKAYLCRKDYYEFYVKFLVSILDDIGQKMKIKFNFVLRQLFDVNALLCCSRSEWTKQEVLDKLFDEPIIQ
jgi:hypothetical protein